jgi:hypothetical protein
MLGVRRYGVCCMHIAPALQALTVDCAGFVLDLVTRQNIKSAHRSAYRCYRCTKRVLRLYVELQTFSQVPQAFVLFSPANTEARGVHTLQLLLKFAFQRRPT